MPIQLVGCESLRTTLTWERSPEVLLLTDAPSGDQLPPAIQEAADRIAYSALTPESFGPPASGAASLVWFAGEQLMRGAPEAVRRNARYCGRTVFVTIHFPCLAHIDLLAVQPRFFAAGAAREESIDFSIRIQCSQAGSPAALAIFGAMRDPWAQLSAALCQDQLQPGAAQPLLERLLRDGNLPPVLDALVLRNLAVLEMRNGRPQQARQLLARGLRRYPDYPELRYIEALLAADSRDYRRTMKLLQEATRMPKGVYAGSGGETSYRAQWLFGTVGEVIGNQSIACGHYFAGLATRPSFEPSVIGVLKQRLPAGVVDSMQWELCHLARREPRYLEAIFYFFLVHRQFSAAQRLLDTVEMSGGQRGVLRGKFQDVRSSYENRPEGRSGPAGVVLEGPFFVHSSIARINGEIAAALLARPDISARLEPHGFAAVTPRSVPNGKALAAALYHRPPYLDLTIRHHWPHDFSRLPAGKLAVIVPWEFGAVPRIWVRRIQDNVDELWVPSRFVKDVFARSGVPAERIAVVPNGVDTRAFSPEGTSWRPPGARGFTFLFVGGAIQRKGADLLVKAYQQAFTARDDVTLIVKDIGSQTFYQHMTLVPWLREQASKPLSPRLLVLTDDLDETKLAELYRGCDAFVLPYRGEGFGMPLAEAMACAKPVITTAAGPAPEFCPDDCSYLIPAKTVPMPDGLDGFGELAGAPTWFEPDLDALTHAMRAVYGNREEAAARGARAGEMIRDAYSWAQIAQKYVGRILALTDRARSATAAAVLVSD